MKEVVFKEAEYIKEDGSNGIIIVAEDGMLTMRSPDMVSIGNEMRCDPIMKDTPENREKIIAEANRLIEKLKKIW